MAHDGCGVERDKPKHESVDEQCGQVEPKYRVDKVVDPQNLATYAEVERNHKDQKCIRQHFRQIILQMRNSYNIQPYPQFLLFLM